MGLKPRLFAALVIGSLIAATPLAARAQDAPTLATLTIQLWPEFDQPSVLVFYVGSIEGEVTEPVDLTFTLPDGATVNASAYVDASTGDLLTAPHTVDGNRVTLTTPNGTFHLEFYHDALQIEGDQRRYTYTWPGDYAVGSLTWEAQQPATAQDLTLDPAGERTTGLFNLSYLRATQTDLDAGVSASATLTYSKPDTTLSADLLAPPATPTPEPVTGASGDAGEGPGSTTVLIAVLVLVGLGLLGGGLYLYNRSKEEDMDAPPRPARSGKGRGRRTRPAARQAASGLGFCTRCGTPIADPGDRFCRNCGAPLRGS